MTVPTATLTTAAAAAARLADELTYRGATATWHDTAVAFLTTYAAQVRREGPKVPEWLPIASAPSGLQKQAEAHLPRLGELIYKLFQHHDGSLWIVEFGNPICGPPRAAIQINRPKDPQP